MLASVNITNFCLIFTSIEYYTVTTIHFSQTDFHCIKSISSWSYIAD